MHGEGSNQMNEEPQGTATEASRDGLAAVAIIVLSVVFIIWVVSNIV